MVEKNKSRNTEKALLGALSVLLLVFVFNIYTKNSSGVQTVLGESDSGSEQSSPSSDEDEDEDDNSGSGDDNDQSEADDTKSETDAEKKAREAAKKQAEREREAAKRSGVKTESSQELSSADDELSEADDEKSESSGSGSSMYQEEAKTLAKLAKAIAEAEEEIAEKQAEGVDVTAAMARLAEAKTLLEAVKAAFTAGELEKAKDLSKQVRKLAHFAKEKDLHDAKEVSEEMGKIAKRISQAYGKIVLFEGVGGNGAPFRSTLATYEAELAALKAKVAAGNYSVALLEGEQETLERKVKRLKSSVESAIYALGATDEEYDDDYERETESLVASLRQVAEIEDEDDTIGKSIASIAEEQEVAATRVGKTVSAIDGRGQLPQILFGTKRSDVTRLEAEVRANQTRIAALKKAAESVTDAEVKAILLEQVAILEGETEKLETFTQAQKDRSGLFGWFFNLF